ncbi:hypothetical protein [Microbacterium lacticum]
MQERFSEWVWENPERAQKLVDEYNQTFNNIVLRDYSAASDYLSLPGLAETWIVSPSCLAGASGSAVVVIR